MALNPRIQIRHWQIIKPASAALLAAALTGCFHTIPTTTGGGTGATATVPACSGAGCCCNSPIEQSNPAAGSWPDCDTGYTCKAMRPGGVLHPSGVLLDVNVCVANGTPLSAPLSIRPGEPSYCRTDM